jgi:hypothetical protein
MAPRFLTILTGRNLPKIRQSREPGPSTINEKTIADGAYLSAQAVPRVQTKPRPRGSRRG